MRLWNAEGCCSQKVRNIYASSKRSGISTNEPREQTAEKGPVELVQNGPRRQGFTSGRERGAVAVVRFHGESLSLCLQGCEWCDLSWFLVSSDVEIEGIETWWNMHTNYLYFHMCFCSTPVIGMTIINWLYHSFQWNMHTFHVSSLLVVSLLDKYLY